MNKYDYADQLLKEKYNLYNLKVPFDKIPKNGVLVETKLNDGTIELVDELAEFTLCKLHSYYFIDRYCKTLDPVKGPIPFKLFDFQKSSLYDFQTNRKVIFRKSRQVGASVITGSYALWRANFYKAQIIKIISLTQKDAIEFKEKTIDINYHDMPGFLKTITTRDGFNRLSLKMVNQSKLSVLSKSKDAGRGGTPSLMIIDEAAFNEWMDDIWKAVGPSLDKGGDIVVISTTNGVGNWYHVTYTKAEQQLNEFHPIFIPWWRYPGRSNPWLQDILDGKIDNVKEFVKTKEMEQLSYEGSPKDAPWLWKMRANSKTDKEFQQEIMAEFLGSGETVITSKTILKLQENIKDPKWVDRLPNDSNIPGLWIWEDVKPGHMYMLTSDTATGHGKDFSTMQLIDVYENEQVGEYKYQIPTDKMGEKIKEIARYYNNAYVVIETNHPGPAVFNEVYNSKIDPYYNCYSIRKGKNIVSWETTAKSRVLLIEDMFKDIENGYTKIYSSRLLEEIKVFNWSDSGKPEALKGYNDDLVLAYSMFAHLKDECFSSQPIGISSSKFSGVGLSETNELLWEEREDKIMNLYGMSLEDWYQLNDHKIPEEYMNILKERREYNKDNIDIGMII